MKSLSAMAVILAFAGAPAHGQSTLTPPMMEGAGPIESGVSASGSTDARAEITTPTVAPVPAPLNTPSRPPQIPGDAASVRHIQEQLNEQGFRTPVNGIWSAETRLALQSFQRSRGFNVSGSLDQRTIAALGVTSSRASNDSVTTPGTVANPSTNPSGVGSTPSSIGNPTGIGSGGSAFGSINGRANISTPANNASVNTTASANARR